MAAEDLGKQPIETKTNNDVVVRVADDGGVNLLNITATGHVLVDLFDEAGAAFAAANPFPAQLSQGDAVLAATNGLPVRITDGDTFNDVSNPLFIAVAVGGATKGATGSPFFVELNQAAAALAAANGLPVRLTDGDAFNDQANPVFAAVSKNTAINAVANPILVQLSDGTTAFGTGANPISVTVVDDPTPSTRVTKLNNASVAANTSANSDHTVPGGKTWTLQAVVFSAPDGGHFELILDQGGTPETILHVHVAAGAPSFVHTFPDQYRVTQVAAQVIRVVRTNDSNRPQIVASTLEITEVP